ncbi:MAG: hypothetical protein BJ554DRAFT_96, partial [Olpidium bornovanus]
ATVRRGAVLHATTAVRPATTTNPPGVRHLLHTRGPRAMTAGFTCPHTADRHPTETASATSAVEHPGIMTFGEGDYHHHYHNLDSKSSAKMDYDSAYSVMMEKGAVAAGRTGVAAGARAGTVTVRIAACRAQQRTVARAAGDHSARRSERRFWARNSGTRSRAKLPAVKERKENWRVRQRQ